MRKAILLFLVTLADLCLHAQGSWTRMADFGGGGRDWAVGFSIGSKCYMGTGVYGTGSTSGGPPLFKDLWEWDSNTNFWTQKADFPGGARSGAVAFSIGNKGYIATGQNNNNAYSDLWEYDPANNSWSQKTNLPAASRADAVAFVIGTKAYIGTGATYQANVLQDLWEWDQTTDTWTRKADYPGGGRIYAVAFSLGTKGYIGTGADFNNQQKDFWEWDQGTNTWIRKADFPFATFYASGFAVGNTGYVGICFADTSQANRMWQWNSTSNIWQICSNFPGTKRWGAVNFSNGTKAYVSMSYPNPPADFWEFDPSGATDIKEEINNSSMQVFPNPAGNNFTIKYVTDVADKLFFSVKNSLGQTVYTDSDARFSGTYNKVIDLGTNAKGIYFVEIICGKDHQINKIVLE